MWGGAVQFLLTAFFLIVQFKHFFIARSHLFAPHMKGVNSTGEAIVTVLIAIEFVFHPLPFPFFLLYLTLEGAVRFVGGIITAEVVPSLLVFLFLQIV